MKNYFDLKTFITVLIAMILFKIIDGLFLEKAVNKMLKKRESFEDYEDVDLDDFDDEDDDFDFDEDEI